MVNQVWHHHRRHHQEKKNVHRINIRQLLRLRRKTEEIHRNEQAQKRSGDDDKLHITRARLPRPI